MLPRATTQKVGRNQGRDSVTKVIRATSKPGAIVTARVDALKIIPFRSQHVYRVESKEDNRLFSKWLVEIRDEEVMDDIA